uniref:Uncharacterized protein n=1 Tax=Panagrolaimus superbus TaxID=310955 RepID=A0A914YDX4_9BILA
MESPVANSSTVADGTSKTNPTSSNSPFTGVPSPAPPFFANPFMSPFIPQQQQQQLQQQQQAGGPNQIIPPNTLQQQMQQQFQQFAAAAAATSPMNAIDPTSMSAQNGSTDFRMNPFTGGFFLPPNQYQEMMQQYLQTLMLQAGNVPLIAPFSEVCPFLFLQSIP